MGRILKMLKYCLCIFFINLYTKFYDYIRIIILFTSDMIYFDYFNFLSTFEFVNFVFYNLTYSTTTLLLLFT